MSDIISVAPLVSASKTSNLDRASGSKGQTGAKSDLGSMTSPDHHPRVGAGGVTSPNKPDISVAKSEHKGGGRKLYSQEEILNVAASAVSPHHKNDGSGFRKNQPRASQDFKMRILTKKKVAVPASATSQSRSQYNQSNASSTSLEPNGGINQPNRQISEEMAAQPVAEQIVSSFSSNGDNNHNATTTSMLQRSKIVTYELCQECGG